MFASSGCIDTLHCILKRQLGAANQPEYHVVSRLARTVKEDVTAFVLRLQSIEYLSQAQYLTKLTGRSRRQVENGFAQLRDGRAVQTELGFFAKHAEKVYPGRVLPSNDRDCKPRCIATFKDSLKAMRMHVQHHISAVMKATPVYGCRSVVGLTGDQLADRLTH